MAICRGLWSFKLTFLLPRKTLWFKYAQKTQLKNFKKSSLLLKLNLSNPVKVFDSSQIFKFNRNGVIVRRIWTLCNWGQPYCPECVSQSGQPFFLIINLYRVLYRIVWPHFLSTVLHSKWRPDLQVWCP